MRFLFKILCLILTAYCISAHSCDLYGHRGARGLSPENTLPAYQTALKIGVNYVDMDVAMTKDHVVVVQHDLTLNPNITRDAKEHWIESNNIIVKNLTLKELQSYDVGQIKPNTIYAKLFSQQQPVAHTYIPTLKEVIEFVKNTGGDRIGFQIEIKTDPTKPDDTYSPQEFAAAVAKVIEEEGIANRTQVQAFDWRCLLALQKINPHIATAYLTSADQEKLMKNKNPKLAGLWTAGYLLKNYHNSIPQMIRALGGTYWDPQDLEVTPEKIQEAHELGLKVTVWSWTEKSGKEVDLPLVKKLVAMQVDGIITDRPDEVKQFMV